MCFECPICGLQIWSSDAERLQQMEDEHTDECGKEGEIEASEIEDDLV
jgi:predicted RNA-binding Zn-ribbon protein involved in translation (DUF1610 family)